MRSREMRTIQYKTVRGCGNIVQNTVRISTISFDSVEINSNTRKSLNRLLPTRRPSQSIIYRNLLHFAGIVPTAVQRGVSERPTVFTSGWQREQVRRMEHESVECHVFEWRMYGHRVLILASPFLTKPIILSRSVDPWRTMGLASIESNAPQRVPSVSVPP
jgi:hypothetical protein